MSRFSRVRRQTPIEAPKATHGRIRHRAVLAGSVPGRVLTVREQQVILDKADALRRLRHVTTTHVLALHNLLAAVNSVTGQCNPAQRTVATHLEINEVTVSRAFKKFADFGLVRPVEQYERRFCDGELRQTWTSNLYIFVPEAIMPTEPRPDGRRSGGSRWPARIEVAIDQSDAETLKDTLELPYVGAVDSVDNREEANEDKELVGLSTVGNVHVEMIDRLTTEVRSPVLSGDDCGLPAEPVANDRLCERDHRSIDAADRAAQESAQRQLRQIMAEIAAQAVSTSLPYRRLPEAPEPIQPPENRLRALFRGAGRQIGSLDARDGVRTEAGRRSRLRGHVPLNSDAEIDAKSDAELACMMLATMPRIN